MRILKSVTLLTIFLFAESVLAEGLASLRRDASPDAEVHFLESHDLATVPTKFRVVFGLRRMGLRPQGLMPQQRGIITY